MITLWRSASWNAPWVSEDDVGLQCLAGAIKSKHTMSLKHLYLAGFGLGTLLPLSQFVPFLLDHGLNVPLFFEQLWANRISSFFGWDVIVCAVVIVVFVSREGQSLTATQRWLCYGATGLIGSSAGLPLFLYFRQRATQTTAPSAP